jgi:anionic cell wall polymer biosynthesis LytR-Cps2A-Psr (LCP) family protein
MVISGLTVVVPKALAWWAFRDVVETDQIPRELLGEDISGAINFLLVGIDKRAAGPDVGSLIRADTIVLVHVPSTHDRIFMISLPRDAEVEIPPYDYTGYYGETTKINVAFAMGARTPEGEVDASPEGQARGAELTMKTISDLVPGGLRFHGSAIIDFEGFEAVVEALGGVHMCIDSDVYSIHFYPNGEFSGDPLWRGLNNEDPAAGDYGEGYHYELGCRDLEPWQALDYSRQRYGLPNGDYDRQRHQQQLLKAIVKKVASSDTITNFDTITRLREAAGGLLNLDLGNNSLEDWVITMSRLRPDDLVMIKTNGGQWSPSGTGSNEVLTAESLELLQAVGTDTVFDFLTKHPDWVATDQ